MIECLRYLSESLVIKRTHGHVYICSFKGFSMHRGLLNEQTNVMNPLMPFFAVFIIFSFEFIFEDILCLEATFFHWPFVELTLC